MKKFARKLLPHAVAGVCTAMATSSLSVVALEEVLVTGTLIRGVQPIGSQTLGLVEEAIVESGAVTTNELLATLPQVANFFNQRPEQDPRGADRLQVNRPNLRNLPGINSGSGATTLVLVDGHRLAPVGTDQSSLDPDVVPANVMRRVEVVTDGGSAIYGADAVGGVINFNTINEYDGVKVDVGYDKGDDYDGWQASVLAGTDWDNGSGFISFATTDRDEVLNSDRDWAAQGNWDELGNTLTPSGTECIEPVGAITTWFWYGAGWTDNPLAPGAGVTPVGDPCDIDGATALLPEQQRDNIYAGITQNFGDNMTLNVKSYYMNRSTTYSRYPLGATVSEPTPTQLGLVGENSGDLFDTSQAGFSFAPNAAYRHRDLELEIETWGITPELTIDLGNSWQLRNTLHYGMSDNTVDQPDVNLEKLNGYVDDGLVSATNIAAADAAVITDILDWTIYDEVEQELFFIRSIADGELFELPAGMLRAAVGVEYSEDETSKKNGSIERTNKGSLPTNSADRDVTSAFAEVSIPVLESLDLSLSVRYDDYSDFGDTTNPQFGFSYRPADWVQIYGKYGESFNAPTVLDSLGVATGRYIANAASIVPDPNMERTNPSRSDVLLLEGASGALQPQTADTWGLGFELRPLDGLRVHAYYYEIDFKQLLGAPNPQSSTAVLLNPDKFIFEPTQEEWEEFVSSVENSEQFANNSPENVGVIVDRRVANTEEATLEGLDFGIEYVHDTAIGTLSYGLLGNYQIDFELTQSGTAVDQLEFDKDLFMSANFGWRKDNARARLTLRYTDEFDADPSIAVNQNEVSDFLVADLYLGYDCRGGSELTEGLSLSLNVENVFDDDPPEYRRNQQLNYSESGFSIGRVYKLGISYEF
ncbi:MAG: TonB-dependent receptor [Halioglobus sp.]|nr:TonB-dependent receptor [Halioglobus sp.]